MISRRATVLLVVSLILICSCKDDSDKSRATQQNKEKFSRHEEKDAHFIVDIVDTSYGVLNVAELAEHTLPDSLSRNKLQSFIQTQTSAMLKFKTFAESKGIAIPFSGPEKTKSSVKKLQDKKAAEFNEAWMSELKKLQHKLNKDIEGYRENADDTVLRNVLDSTLMLIKRNNMILADLEKVSAGRSIN